MNLFDNGALVKTGIDSVRKWKSLIGSDEHSEYFLRDRPNPKSWYVEHVFLISYDYYIKDSIISTSLPTYNVANVNIGFVI